MKIMTILGARPQFIKASVVSKELQKNNIEEVIVHTGQHFDENMSKVFFDELSIPSPRYNLGINSSSHGAMTGEMLKAIEGILLKEEVSLVLVYGDTNSTLAGALAASKLNIPVAHVESGLRSFNKTMPEEINRILTDHISTLLFCPTQTAVKNLQLENITGSEKVILSGDVMFDVVKDKLKSISESHKRKSDYSVVTLHRQENTNSKIKFESLLSSLSFLSKELNLVWPVHPRIKSIIQSYNLPNGIELIDPLSYGEMISLVHGSSFVLTDSGGLQKEAYFLKRPCITLREETEWVELVDARVNFVVGSDFDKIKEAFNFIKMKKFNFDTSFYGNGDAAIKIVEKLKLLAS
jgi:UDP-GlcNAc3NAcA epimerase